MARKSIRDYFNVINKTTKRRLHALPNVASVAWRESPLRSTMTDERLSSLAIPHIHKHKNVDWRVGNGVARLKGRRLALCFWPVFIVFVQLSTAFLPHYLLKMPRRKTRRWHFRGPKFQTFGGTCPQSPLDVSAFGAYEKFYSRAYIFKIPRYAPANVTPEPYANEQNPLFSLN